jgi:hypothetical protein
VALSVGAHRGMLLTVGKVLDQLANDDSRAVAAAAQAAVQQLAEADAGDEILGPVSGHVAGSPPAAASLMAAAELEVKNLRTAADQEVAQKRAAADQEMTQLRIAAAREVALIIESAKQERAEILATAQRQADEFRAEAQRILAANKAAQDRASRALADADAAERRLEEANKQYGKLLAARGRASERLEPERSAAAQTTIQVGGMLEPLDKARDLPPGTTRFTGDAPIIQGVYCKNGHFGDPEALFCGVCGISMNSTDLMLRPGEKPPLRVLVLDDGSVFQLDRNYVIGREPGLDATVASGLAAPLVVSDDSGKVSRVHAKVTLDGWHVLVTDLSSANGTRVRRLRAFDG